MSSSTPDARAAVNLLWTGGWDSTFQLLRLLLLQGRHVTPYYLMDPDRPSTQVELDAMQRMRERLADEYPQTRQLLLPAQVFRVDELAPDPAIEDAFDRVVQSNYIGTQYAWLARFCKQHGIDDMELCIHRDDKAHAAVAEFVNRQTDAGYLTYRFDPGHAQTAEYELFGRFSFPLLDVTKIEMAREAEEHGWKAIMGMTWFCHQPRGNRQPCGRCGPCIYTIEEGLGWRVPLPSRLVSYVYRYAVRPLKRHAKAMLRHRRTATR